MGLWARRHPILALAAAVYGPLMVVYVIMNVVSPPPPPTPEELQARQAMAEETARKDRLAAERTRLAFERTRSLCRYQAACKKYAEARQECAPAGNFTLCVNVKVEDKGTELASVCNNDGTLKSAPTDMPNRIQCFASDVGEALSVP
jgi:hypothetical protein